MISVIVKKAGEAEEIIGETITSPLIVTEPQATKVGVQVLSGFYSNRALSLLTPFRGLSDGQVINFATTRPNIVGNFWVTSVSIQISLEEGVNVTLGARDYAWKSH
jgi:hypothetical protein